ncbi:MAG: lysine--tRNA ligase [Spirochaetaceae bacterium]|nr:MAG: lysine--tRNA ligase [Spirochaetaceae bacterium]
MSNSAHWADNYAEKIIREKGDKELYVCASGVTPSGTVHIGNFREIITVELVVRALRDRGKKVRFIYSWDDYDVFRKVPKNMPKQEMLGRYLRQPITLTPDPYEVEESYARRNEREIEELLPIVGVNPEYIYQAKRYRASGYAEGIRRALEHRDRLREILDEHRSEPLPSDWWPISVFCTSCNRDTTQISDWDGKNTVAYSCSSCGQEERLDLENTPAVKLFWRVDWPMRWAHEEVDFEPAGKDHHSEGGSFDTARRIVKEIYGQSAPTTFQYDFIGIKGRGGKISSSSGEVVSLRDVLEIYQPELIRYMFASSRPNTEFAISFDLDVIKLYEEYDRCERIYYGGESMSESRTAKERRIYELSQVANVAATMPIQIPFRHLCNLIQIQDGNVDGVIQSLNIKTNEQDLAKIRTRARCAWNWTRQYAPDSFRFSLRPRDCEPLEIIEAERKAIVLLRREIEEKLDSHDERSLSEAIYALAGEAGMEAKEFFKLVYRVLIEKEMGPRLAGFLLTIGRERALELLGGY